MPGESSRVSTSARRRGRAVGLALLAACAVFALVVAGLASALLLAMPRARDPAWWNVGDARDVRRAGEAVVRRRRLGDWSQVPRVEACRSSDPQRPRRPHALGALRVPRGLARRMRFHTDGRASAAHAEQTVSAVRQTGPTRAVPRRSSLRAVAQRMRPRRTRAPSRRWCPEWEPSAGGP